jgi:prepilin-type N-terminal cleavage/methylation domain-containing protein
MNSYKLGERGLTMIELLLALTVFAVVLAGALSFLSKQSKTFSLGNERFAMVQNMRFGLNVLEKDLRTAGAANPDEQPALIYAGNSVVAFNGNYITNVDGDVFAVYYNPDAPSGTVGALTKGDQITIPLTSFVYPDTTYWMDPARTLNSPSETIIFYFAPDSETARTDDYILYRQVNAETREILTRNVLPVTGVPFFRYYRNDASSGVMSLAQVPAAQIPLAHSVPVHLALGDTAQFARIDSVKGVQVSFTVSNGLTGTSERKRTIQRLIRLPNAGLRNKKICGDEPMLGAVAFNAVPVTLPTGLPAVNLTWNPATDENGGEKDVVLYVLWRRLDTDLDWGEPYLSLPAGSPSYFYSDTDVEPATNYVYALAAQDCTPKTSNSVASPLVSIP